MIRKKSLILLILIVGALFWFSQSDARKGSVSPPNTTGAENPLPPCPESPNCVRASKHINQKPDDLLETAETALHKMRAVDVQVHVDQQTINAVFEVFVFKDDVTLAIRPHEAGSVIHVRSASRTGYSDWGVNGKRVNELWETLGTLQ